MGKTLMINEKLVDHWIQYQLKSRLNSADSELFEWAADEVMDLSILNLEQCWQFILSVISKTDDQWVLTNIGAGPIEDMLATDSELTFSLIKNSLPNKELNFCITNVWQNLMSESTFKKVKKLI
jgi:hypothetical protein